MDGVFDRQNFHLLCDHLARQDTDLHLVIQSYGYPPLWTRAASFQTLVHIILEQQVSLASARAALNKLKQRLGNITPRKLLSLSDAELRACYFSRQKSAYSKDLAQAIVSRRINLKALSLLEDGDVRRILKTIKGVGDWTVDVYLLFALQRADIFPVGDLAVISALKEVKKLDKSTTRDVLVKLSESWQPYRSVATMILWHYYIQKRGIRLKS